MANKTIFEVIKTDLKSKRLKRLINEVCSFNKNIFNSNLDVRTKKSAINIHLWRKLEYLSTLPQSYEVTITTNVIKANYNKYNKQLLK